MLVPPGFGTLTPYLFVADARRFIAFLQEAFGAEQAGVTLHPDGGVARLEMAVADMPYGDRQGGVLDPFGNLWWISQRLVDAPYY